MEIREQVTLAPYTTMKIGGPARFFVEVQTLSDVDEAVRFAKNKKLPIFILGGGSNLLVRDDGYPGLVIHVRLSGVEWKESHTETLIAGSGEVWDDIVVAALHHGYAGIENLSLIPGTVGGAVVQNIGAYGRELSACVSWVDVFNMQTETVMRLTKEACAFAYRDSVFKHGRKNLIVLRAGIHLVRDGVTVVEYPDIKKYLSDHGISGPPSPMEVRRAIVAIRTAKLPPLSLYGTAGSFFVNPVVSREVGERFSSRFPDAPCYAVDDMHDKLSAGWIIDHVLHMRGIREGNVGCYEKQALVLVNYGGASSKEMYAFVKKIQQRALSECEVELLPEVIDVHAP
jgi:UDP-N-acetylmuramate dehydrogenase